MSPTIVVVGARTGVIEWLVSVAISAAIVLPAELTRHHFASHRLSARIGGAILVWIAVATVIRFIMFFGTKLGARSPQ
jgi:hypothetical protein